MTQLTGTMAIPAFTWGKVKLPEDMSQNERRVFDTIQRCGFLSFVQATAELCRRQARVPGRAQRLWEFRVGYFCRYMEEERKFLDGKTRFQMREKQN